MSTYSYISKMRRGAGLSALSVLGGVLIALQLVLPSLAFARSAQHLVFGQSQALDRASVSVVRLVVTYTGGQQTKTQRFADVLPSPVVSPPPTTPGTTSSNTACTLLGVLVGSWLSGNPSEMNTWVLTDGSLVNPISPACTTANIPLGAQLSSIQVFASATYTANPTSLATFPITSSDLRCEVPTSCARGAALIPFHLTVPQPFVDVATTDTTESLGIELKGTSGTPQANLASQFLTPTSVAPGDFQAELGTPIVNSEGQLTSLRLNATGSFSTTDISNFLQSVSDLKSPQPTHLNPLHDNWNKGVTDFYAKNYAAARTEFHNAGQANPQFRAAQAFETLAAQKASGGGIGRGTPTATTGTGSTPTEGIDIGGGLIIPYLVLSILGLLVLIGIFVLASVRFGRARAQRKRDQEREIAEANRRAEIDAQRIRQAEMERQSTLPIQQSALAPNKASTKRPKRSRELPCPNCGKPVQADATFCTNCGALLAASESGLHMRVKPDSPASPESPISAGFQTAARQSQPLPAPVPAASMSEQPTIALSPTSSRPTSGQAEAERTVPYTVEQFSGRNLSFAVGTRSDPGIKRKHKPNEDSLLAIQGERTHDSSPQQFGLFVVADGMGGHASGQDASRLAIQTIVNQVLPRVSGSGEMDEKALVQLLVEGVQQANVAVHQRNMEQHADMGTTMTAALVVGAMAYVANVGDSRTYLYREPEGLRKITNDHSVVASLVEAGIIKPDDIYTHPKRNQIYRSLGEKPLVDVDAFTVQLQPGDKLLLCSDGLWDMVRDPKIEGVMKNYVQDPNMTGNALIKEALEGGGEDNVSVIVVHITEATKRTGMTGIQLVAKPDTVEIPKI